MSQDTDALKAALEPVFKEIPVGILVITFLSLLK